MAAKPLPDQQTLLQLLRYEPETGKLFWRNHPHPNTPSGREALYCISESGYRRARLVGRNVMAHRVIWKMLHGTEPDQIDHINGDRLDNRAENLRDATCQDNARNQQMRSTNTSGRTGVKRDKTGWLATIRHDGRTVASWHKTFEAAAAARAAAEKRFGYHPNHGRKTLA